MKIYPRFAKNKYTRQSLIAVDARLFFSASNRQVHAYLSESSYFSFRAQREEIFFSTNKSPEKTVGHA